MRNGNATGQASPYRVIGIESSAAKEAVRLGILVCFGPSQQPAGAGPYFSERDAGKTRAIIPREIHRRDKEGNGLFYAVPVQLSLTVDQSNAEAFTVW